MSRTTRRTAAKPASAPSQPPLTGCHAAFAGTFGGGMSQAGLQKDVLGLGGEVDKTVGPQTTHLVTTEKEVQKGSKKVKDALEKGQNVKVVGAEWVSQCVEKGAKADEGAFFLLKKNGNDAALDGAVDGAADTKVTDGGKRPLRGKKRTAPVASVESESDVETKAPPPKKQQKVKEEAQSKPVPDKTDVKSSRPVHVPVDEACPLQLYQVYIDPDGTIYDAALNLTNSTGNNNKFYRLQLLHDPARDDYKTWTRWGRVGERGQSAMLGSGALTIARQQFEKKFKDKSGLQWDDRGKDPKPGKYAFIERNYASDSEDEDEDGGKDGEKDETKLKPTVKSTLEKPVQDLMALIFNQDYFAATMSDLNYDANKLPLGKLSKTTISRGFQTLKDLSELLDDTTLAMSKYGTSLDRATEQLSNQYYTLIPHDFGRNRPPIIRFANLLKKEVELLESLSDMKDAALIMKVDKQAAADAEASGEHPLDRQYRQLGLEEMTPLEEKSDEYRHLLSYLHNTRGHTHAVHYNVQNIFRIERKGEPDRLAEATWPEARVGSDRRLLWHGSRCTNFGGILSQGLRIAPPEAPVSGYMFGKGIYLADMSSKSAGYCRGHTSGGHALLLLCEAELGRPMQELTVAKSDAAESARALGALSTWGKGRTGPTVWKDAAAVHPDLRGIRMPDVEGAPPGETKVEGACLQYNEYICYDVRQVRLRYLFRIKT